MQEEELYPLVAHWLRMQGYDPVIAGGQRQLSIPIVSLLPGKLFVEPDIVGLKDDSRLVAIEVKTDPKEVREGLGQCLIYTMAADDVYLALTEDLCREIRSLKFFDSVRIGLLCLRETKTKVTSVIDESGMKVRPAQDPGDFRLSTGWWCVEQKIAPKINFNTDFAGLRAELLRQTKLALGRA